VTADLAGSQAIQPQHPSEISGQALVEALQYRPKMVDGF